MEGSFAKALMQAALLVAGGLSLASCGERTTPPSAPATTPAAAEAPAKTQCVIRVVPGQPHSSDCLNALIEQQPPNSRIVWRVNGSPVESRDASKLFPEAFRRGDRVDITVEGEQGVSASAAVTIANSPPKVTGISATPDQVFAGSDVRVTPVGEDRDGDPVDFRYQWLINDEVDPLLTTNTLPGTRFTKGNVIQVRVTPHDGIDEGEVYESYRMTIPNAPPRIESTPPQEFAALDYSYRVKAGDPDGDSLTWRLDKAPQGMTIDSGTGLVKWPLTGVSQGDYPLKIVVSDPDGAEAFQEFNLTLGAPK